MAFHTTLWSRIEDAQEGDPGAVDLLVQRYTPPLLRYLGSKGFSREDAEDLAQEVFLRLLAKEALARADRERGRFRSFLLGVAKNVVRQERARRGAGKRGGGVAPVSLDEVLEVAQQDDEEAFDRIWVAHLIQRALDGLARENPRQHQVLELRIQHKVPYQDIARRMGRNLQQVKNDLHRARRRLAAIIKADVAAFASSREEYEVEVALVMSYLGLNKGR